MSKKGYERRFLMMNNVTNLSLPKELESFRSEIENTLIPMITISPYERSTTLTESKFAGEPYLPYMWRYPKDITGEPMRLLAQINFAEIPRLQDFPTEGILQFFISSTIFANKIYAHEDIFQQFYKVRFFPTIKTDVINNQGSTIQTLPPLDYFPIKQELALLFSKTIEPVSAFDYRATQYLQSLSQMHPPIKDDSNLHEIYLQYFLGAGAKIGGYPYFIQEDIRKDSSLLLRYDVLLLQIDSNDECGIMWGDSGVGKFLINREKLLQLDFSDILFQWEHY